MMRTADMWITMTFIQLAEAVLDPQVGTKAVKPNPTSNPYPNPNPKPNPNPNPNLINQVGDFLEERRYQVDRQIDR